MDFDDEDLASVSPVQIDPNEVMDSSDLEEALDSNIGMPQAWKELAMMAGRRAEERFDPVCYIDNPETDTQVWAFLGGADFGRRRGGGGGGFRNAGTCVYTPLHFFVLSFPFAEKEPAHRVRNREGSVGGLDWICHGVCFSFLEDFFFFFGGGGCVSFWGV
ncbi:MAG: hypothetical protein Pars93KO_27060 [Parasphingorhabdus sp.]